MTESLQRSLTAAGAMVRTETRPGDIGEIIRLHGLLYPSEHGYSIEFEAYVAKTFSGYRWPLGPRERLWIVEKPGGGVHNASGTVRGSIAIVKASETVAQLRWLLLHPDLRGHGLGKALVEEAVSFSRETGYASVVLWTEGSLETATTLYRRAGFTLTEQKSSEVWGAVRTEERYDLKLR